MNENDINNLLCELFQYKNRQGKFEILQNFLDSCCPCITNRIKVNSPKITAEEKRIDVLVEDADYSLIIESKAKGADDQENQLANYINKEKQEMYDNGQIFVAYISNSEPEKQSWGKYRLKFEDRYERISLRTLCKWFEHILKIYDFDEQVDALIQKAITSVNFIRFK